VLSCSFLFLVNFMYLLDLFYVTCRKRPELEIKYSSSSSKHLDFGSKLTIVSLYKYVIRRPCVLFNILVMVRAISSL
jgi:hypothetical protein